MDSESRETHPVEGLDESKAVGTYRGKRRDLRALEAQALATLYGKKHERIVRKQKDVAEKELKKVKKNFKRNVTTSVEKLARGEISLKQAVDKTSAEIRNAYQTSYSLGLKAQGHGALSTKQAPLGYSTTNATKEDHSWLKTAADEEISYMKGFLRDVNRGLSPSEEDKQKEREGLREPTRKMPRSKRVEMYARALDGVYAAGQVRGAPDNVIIYWLFGDAEHCPECIYLEANSPFTKQSLPTTPRAGSTRCLTNCKCVIVFDYPPMDVYKALQRDQPSRTYHLKKLTESRHHKHGLPELRMKHMKEEWRTKGKKLLAERQHYSPLEAARDQRLRSRFRRTSASGGERPFVGRNARVRAATRLLRGDRER